MAKQLFKSSEKSNFILNMTEEKYSSIASKILFFTCIAVSLFTLPYELSENVGSPLISGGLAVCGVTCMIMALIAAMKKYITKDMLVPVGAFGFMLVWGVISLINSYDVKISFYGFDGRGEGILAIIFYFCFFITALTIKGKKSVSLVMDAVAAVGTINALWGIMQIFGAVPTNYGSVVATVPWDSTDKINAASGLSQSPLFLAMVLGISLVTVLSGAVLCEKKARRVIYAVSGCIMSFVLIFTYSVAGWIAFGIAVVTSFILVFTKKVPKKRLISIACAVLSSALAIQLICFGVGNIYGKYKLHDGPIMWWDSWYRIEASGDYNLPEVKDSYTALDDVSYVYKYTFGKTIDIIKENALVGTGPENLIFPQVNEQIIMSDGSMRIAGESGTSNEGTFDKVYNEFLYVAATRGIPSLIAFVVLLVSVLAKGIGKLRKNKCGIIEIFSVAAVIGGIGVMLAGVSNITFAPVFWICAGLCAGNASAFKPKK